MDLMTQLIRVAESDPEGINAQQLRYALGRNMFAMQPLSISGDDVFIQFVSRKPFMRFARHLVPLLERYGWTAKRVTAPGRVNGAMLMMYQVRIRKGSVYEKEHVQVKQWIGRLLATAE